jgi:RNase P/RNase MRP subunit p29
MRDLYYEVIRLDKKGLSFRFNLIKGKEISVQGAAFVKFGAKTIQYVLTLARFGAKQ